MASLSNELRSAVNQRAGNTRDAALENAERHHSPLRGAVLIALFALVISCAVALYCAVMGILISYLVDAGLVSFEFITSPASIIGFIMLGSLPLAALASTGIAITLVQPLQLMTRAMSRLAQGDFSYRVQMHGRFRLRETEEFAQSFNVAAQELANTEMMRETFIGDFSHEFRTPINSLCGFAQLLREGDLTSEEQNEYLDIIIEESSRLAGLSDQILTLTRIEHVEILPDVAPVNVTEQLRRAVIMAESKWQEKELDIKLALDPCVIYGNADYLMRMWSNLIDNACKFSEHGGSVSVALYGGRSAEELRGNAGDEMVCWISDEGCGMDAQTRAHLFDRFYQGDTSHAAEGSGLGLSLCRRIAELHRGSISVESAPGEGSVFEVRLPLHRS